MIKQTFEDRKIETFCNQESNVRSTIKGWAVGGGIGPFKKSVIWGGGGGVTTILLKREDNPEKGGGGGG